MTLTNEQAINYLEKRIAAHEHLVALNTTELLEYQLAIEKEQLAIECLKEKLDKLLGKAR